MRSKSLPLRFRLGMMLWLIAVAVAVFSFNGVEQKVVAVSSRIEMRFVRGLPKRLAAHTFRFVDDERWGEPSENQIEFTW